MYIETVPNRNSPPAVLLREGWREGKRTRKRTLANLSAWPQEKIETFRRLLRDERLVSPQDLLTNSHPTKETINMATAFPLVDIQDPGTDLARKTVFIKLHLGLVGNSRKVSSSQVEVDADKALIRVSKNLLDSPELQAIRSLDGDIRRYLYDTCLPFDVGIHLLPLGLIETVDERLREFKAQREELVEAFSQAYPRLCQEAAGRLRTLYNPADYPPVDEVRACFTLSWQYISYGVPEQLGEISARIFETEREKAAQAMSQACSEIQQVMRGSLLEMVNHLRERLSDQPDGKPQRLRESTVQKLRDFLAIFDLRNVVDDQELKEQVEKARALLEGVSTDSLRNMPLVRARVREGMVQVAARMDVLVSDRVSRKFRFDEA